MDPARVEVGAVLQWADQAQQSWRVRDDRPFRVLTCDSGVVMYDSWWPHRGEWGVANLDWVKKRRINYHVVTASTLAEKATFVRSEPLTEAEIALHRPHLPFATGQCQTLSWPAEAAKSAEAFARSWRSAGCREAETLTAPEVYLFPFGPKGGERAGTRVKADNGTSFGPDELAWKASVIQAPFVRADASVQGIGIYRAVSETDSVVRALLTAIATLDDLVRLIPDSMMALSTLEEIAFELGEMGSDERRAFIDALNRIAAEEPGQADWIHDLPLALGLVDGA